MSPLGAARAVITAGGAVEGSLELIQTQSGSGVGQVDFTDIKEDEYNVHFLTITDFQIGTDGQPMGLRFSNGSFISSGYQWALQIGQADGTTDEARSTSSTYLELNRFNGDQSNEKANGYVYLYDLGDSTKYSFYTSQVTATLEYSTRYGMEFGSGLHPTAETISGIRLTTTSGNISATSVSLYGIKES